MTIAESITSSRRFVNIFLRLAKFFVVQLFICCGIVIDRDARHMAHDVDLVLQKIVASQGTMDDTSAQEYLKRLRSRGRYSCDVWS